MTDYEEVLDLKTPTECDDKEVSMWKARCSSKASLQHKGHKDHKDDVELPMGFMRMIMLKWITSSTTPLHS